MIELNTDDLGEMILSRDAESRRLGFTIIFQNIKQIPETKITTFKETYREVINIRMGMTGGFYTDHDEYKKTHYLSFDDVWQDAEFIVDNVCQDKTTLEKIFNLNINRLLKHKGLEQVDVKNPLT